MYIIKNKAGGLRNVTLGKILAHGEYLRTDAEGLQNLPAHAIVRMSEF